MTVGTKHHDPQRLDIVAPATVVTHGILVSLFSKNSQLFCMNYDGDKLYMKFVAFDDIYNFLVQTFFI
jgi:hypothetical protein